MQLWVDKTAWFRHASYAKAQRLPREQVESVAVIKHAALGDMVMIRPFLVTAREFFPSAKITLCVTSTSLNGVPQDLVDRVHVVPRRLGGEAGVRATWRSFRALGPHDVLFDLAATNRSYWITALNHARLKVGFRSPRGQHRLLYDLALARSEYKFEAETLLDMLNALGATHEMPLRFDLPRLAGKQRGPNVVYFPTAAERVKCWDAERYGQLLELMVERHPGFEHVLLVGLDDWEREYARDIVDASGCGDRVELVQSKDETFATVQNASVLVSGDTGIRNYAIAAGTRTLGIFFATLPFRYFPRFDGHRVVFDPDKGMPSVDDVASELDSMLASR